MVMYMVSLGVKANGDTIKNVEAALSLQRKFKSIPYDTNYIVSLRIKTIRGYHLTPHETTFNAFESTATRINTDVLIWVFENNFAAYQFKPDTILRMNFVYSNSDGSSMSFFVL